MSSDDKSHLIVGKYKSGENDYKISVNMLAKEVEEIVQFLKNRYPNARTGFYLLLAKEAVHYLELEHTGAPHILDADI